MTREEAIKNIKLHLDCSNVVLSNATKEAFDVLIPELAESEDERIRKGLINIFNSALGQDFLQRKAGLDRNKVIAYLEKQKEQKSRIDACGFPLRDEGESACSYLERCLAPDMRNIWYEACSEIKEKQKEQKDYRKLYEDIAKSEWFKKAYEGKSLGCDDEQKAQKPVEKEITLTSFEGTLNTFLFDFANSPIEDCEPKEYIKKHSAEILKAAYKELNAKLQQDIFEARQEGIRDGYEVAKAEQKPAVTHGETYHVDTLGTQQVIAGKMPQKPAEWSEEDVDMLNSCISSIEEAKENRYAYKETDGDTSYDHEIAWLKSLRPSWKPSKEQMSALVSVTKNLFAEMPERHRLESLHKDLKKLM